MESFKKCEPDKFNLQSPILFFIPSHIYSDELEKERDRETFLKIQKLHKKCEQLRQKLHGYSKQHVERLKIINYLVLRSKNFNRNNRRKNSEN